MTCMIPKTLALGATSDIDMSEPSLCMKIGHEEWSPNRTKVGNCEWKCVVSGQGWAVWEDKRFCADLESPATSFDFGEK